MPGDQTSPDPSLLRILARAHDVQARLIQNPTLSVHDVAKEEQVSAAYLYTLLRLPWLAPDITTAITNGRKPPKPTAQQLMRLMPRLPANWGEQRKLLGFRREQTPCRFLLPVAWLGERYNGLPLRTIV